MFENLIKSEAFKIFQLVTVLWAVAIIVASLLIGVDTKWVAYMLSDWSIAASVIVLIRVMNFASKRK